jgi:hypothetical protein
VVQRREELPRQALVGGNETLPPGHRRASMIGGSNLTQGCTLCVALPPECN